MEEYKTNELVRSLYQSIENTDIPKFKSILSKLKNKTSVEETLPNLLGFVCENAKAPDILISILELGIHPDTPNLIGQFPLHLAVENGNEDYVQILLNSGANPNITDANGVTPLHISYSYDSLGNISDLLLSMGADINIRDHLGKRYLM